MLHIAWYMRFADMCATYFKAPALNVRLPCATAMPPCVWTCRAMCTGMLCYPLYSTWDWRVCVSLTSRHLLCVYVCRVLRLCRLVPGRVVLCVAVCCATHCMVHGIRGYVCHLLQGTCSVCTFAVCYGYAALCLDCLLYTSPSPRDS